MANTRSTTQGRASGGKRMPWRPEHIALLKRMAATRPAGLIAWELGRTESAVRSKAHQQGISFESAERSPYGKPARRRRAGSRAASGNGGGRGRSHARGAAARSAGGRAGASTTSRGGRRKSRR